MPYMNVNLNKVVSCPNGIGIEIEGLGERQIQPKPGQSILDCIAAAFVFLSNVPDKIINSGFQRRVKILELDEKKKYLKVRILPERKEHIR